jgi:choice-of-anchor B domain-containing protein
VRFLAQFVSPSGGGYTAGCWGWTDTTTGREYALLGNHSGTAIVEITNVDSVIERDFVPGPSSNWRELQTWSHYAYVVSEGGGGTQIIDLAYLPDSVHLVQGFIYSDSTNRTNRAHTIQIRDGYMYLNGCVNYAGGGVLIFSLADPEHPAFVSQYTVGNYIHDCFVRKDTMYAAAIYGVGVEIVDVTDKSYPALLATITYPGSGTHNCAVSSDGGYLLTTDEIGATDKTLKFWDIRSLPGYSMVAEYTGNPSAIVHNVFVRDSLAFLSHYTAGIRVVDIHDPANPVEIGGYDSCPDSIGSGAAFTGAWSVYPFFPSGKIIIGDMVSGLFIVDLGDAPTDVRDDAPLPGQIALSQNYPNPFNPSTTIEYILDASTPVSLVVYDLLGRPVATLQQGVEQAGSHQIRWNGTDDHGRRLGSGVYIYRLAAGGRSIAKSLLLLQ